MQKQKRVKTSGAHYCKSVSELDKERDLTHNSILDE